MKVKFARIVFNLAGIYGLIALVPLYFLESRIAIETPPAITHPENYYGFIGVGVVWQIAFLLIASDPIRYRPLMLVSVLEKISFGIPVAILFAANRVGGNVLAFTVVDWLLAVCFLAAWVKCGRAGGETTHASGRPNAG